MKQIHFFALKEDLLAMLELVESKSPLKYVRTGNFASHDVGSNAINTGSDIPNLGKANADQWINCDSYLVCEEGTPISLRTLRGVDGRDRVCVDQLANPDSVTFTPGGIWNEDVVLNGRIATASDSQISGALMKRFLSAVKKTCSKVKAFYVGPKALVLLQNGKRLAGAVQSPREYDLVAESVKT